MRRFAAAASLIAVTALAGLAPTPARAQLGEGGGLGGFALSATASPIIVIFDAPSAGIPASPIMEWDLGYTHARLESGPAGRATASPIWPGETAATVGPFMSSEINGQFRRNGAPEEFQIPTIPSWPVKAETFFPQSPYSDDRSLGAVATMKATSRESMSEAVTTLAGFGLDAVVDAGSVRSVSRAIANKNDAVTEVRSVIKDLVVAGGLITADKIVTEAVITSDGEAAVVDGDTTIAGLTVGGVPFLFDGKRLQMAEEDDGGGLAGAVNQLADEGLSQLGIDLRLAPADDLVDGPVASRAASALSIELTNKAGQAFMDGMPKEMRREIAPFAGTDQTVRIVLGGVTASTAASPPFVFDLPEFRPEIGGGDSGFTPSGDSGTDVLGTGATGSTGGDLGDIVGEPPAGSDGLGNLDTRPALAQPVSVEGVTLGVLLLAAAGLYLATRVMRRMSDTLLGAAAKEAACPQE